MKHLSLILLSTISLTHCMHQEIITTTKSQNETNQEWDDKAYSEANSFQEKVAWKIIKDTDFTYTGENLADFGCGPGNISKTLAEKARSVHGVDASENMIKHAKETYTDPEKLSTYCKNISFEQCSIEKFKTNKLYGAATIFNCLHWFKDKNAALKQINKALIMGSNIVGNVRTAPSPNLDLVVAKELVLELIKKNMITVQDATNLTNTQETDPTKEEFRAMLKKNEFYIRYYKEKSFNLTFANKEEVEKLYRPIIMAHAITKLLPEEQHEALFTRFIELFVEKMHKNEHGEYCTPMVTTVFKAMKINDVQ